MSPHWHLLRDPGHLLSLGGGVGLAPRAPGTFGTLVGVAVYWAMIPLERPQFIALTAVFFLCGIYLCGRTAAAMDAHDHPAIVWDEIVGFLAAMAFVEPSLLACVCGFIAFRFFDILKPWPISLVDRAIHGGLGIMLDDLLAGCATALFLVFIEYLSYI